MDRKFLIEQLDQARLIKVNDLPQVTNPVMFNANNGPTSDGLLSNELFGITKDERSGIFGYIDLGEKFINPYYYKIWLKLDRNLRSCIYETQNFVITPQGYLQPVEDGGETGLKFLIKNIEKINFKDSKKINFLKALKDARDNNKLFTKYFVVIPPFYRDVETNGSGRVGVGEINKLYVNLMNNIKALRESTEYGLSVIGGVRGKIQDIMLEVYNWYTLGESIIGGEHTGAGIFKKFGIVRRSVMSKTSDYSARLVLTAPSVDVDKKEDLLVNTEYSAIPLSAAVTISYPFMIYYLRQWFANEFGGQNTYRVLKNGEVKEYQLINPQVEFSDDRFDKELNEFIHGYSNRFKAIEVPTDKGNIKLAIKGYSITPDQYASGKRESEIVITRYLTWVDLFYICACKATQDKMVIISRYPIDSHFNQLYTKMHISSTIKTEPMLINGEYYKWYPRIRMEDIGSDTSNKFIDSCQITNPYCKLMGADYDGDQVTVKMPFSVEANKELEDHLNSTGQFIALNGENGRIASNESIQAIYNLTLVLPGTELTDPKF